MNKIFLDNNSTCKPYVDCAVDAMEISLSLFENPSASYASLIRDKIEACRGDVASLIDCPPRYVHFTSGGTEANSIALKCRVELGEIAVGTDIEHSSVYNACIDRVNINNDGTINLNHLENILKKWSKWKAKRTLSVMYANNETGIILDPSKNVPELAAKYGWNLHIDAVQAIGKTNIRFDDLQATSISISGHKFGSVKGIGALISNSNLEPIFSGGSQEFGLRPGTENVLGILNLGLVANKLREIKIDNNIDNTKINRNKLIDGLKHISEPNGSMDYAICNTVNLYFPGIPDAEVLVDDLATNELVYASSRAACLSGEMGPSRVIRSMYGDTSDRATKSVRFSLSHQTTSHEIDDAIDRIKRSVERIKV